MKTAFIRACAISIVILGLALHCCANFTLRTTETEKIADRFWTFEPIGGATVEKKEWWPWAMCSGGIIVFIYTFTLPKRGGGAGKEH